MNNIFRLGYENIEIDGYIPPEFSSLEWRASRNSDERFSVECVEIMRNNKLIELIIIPDRYFADQEVLQTVQVRDVAHAQRGGVGIVMSSSDAQRILEENIFSEDIFANIYKISTIRHGMELQTKDENANILLAYAERCVAVTGSKLCEIVIRACGGAGQLRGGLADPDTLTPIGMLYGHDFELLGDESADQSRLFLHGLIAEAGTAEYKKLKLLTVRTQTLNIQQIALTDPSRTNVLYAMRESLNQNSKLRHLSVKSYFDVVNPVPEGSNPIRMGLWFAPRRIANLSFPKAVRLISPDYVSSDGGSGEFEQGRRIVINHLVRPIGTTES